VTETYWIIWEI